VSVDHDQQNAQRFWSAVLDAIRSPAPSIDPEKQQAAIAARDGDQMVDTVLSELAEQVEPVVLIIDDLHELRSADALTQLEHLLPILPSSARVVLSSRRDPPIRLHQLRLADEIAEIRARDLQFTEPDGQEGAIGALLRSFPGRASVDHPDLALARAATQLAQGRLEEAAAQLALAESHIQSTPPARRRRRPHGTCASSQPGAPEHSRTAPAPACAQSPDSGVAGSLGRAAG
jgi:ATP/maltotriose-dependent transcriptional regulator MalT